MEDEEKKGKNYKQKKAPEKLSKMARKFKLDRMGPSKMWPKFKKVCVLHKCGSGTVVKLIRKKRGPRSKKD